MRFTRLSGYDGVGILVFTKSKDSILGVDIDDCFSGGKLSDKAHIIIDALNTYTEKSPYGQGVRCIGMANTPIALKGCRVDKVELYTDRHFLTITGHRLNDNPPRYCQKEFEDVHAQFIAKNESEKKDNPLHDLQESSLFNGDISGFASESEADLALCRLIYSHGTTDPQEIDSIFRESALYDVKWDRLDYRDNTIAKAIELEQQSPKTIRPEIKLLDTKMMITTPPAETPWLIRDFIPEGQTGQMIGDGKIGKSSMLIQIAVAVASGISKAPFFIDTPNSVLIVNVEDPSEQIHAKVYHQAKHFDGIDLGLIKANLHIADGLGKIGPLMLLGPNKAPIQSDYGKDLEALIHRHKPKLVILDTKSRLYGLDENNNDHATQWLFQLERIAREVNCSFLIAHHTGKGQSKQTGRGASAFDNNTRFRIILTSMNEATASKFGVEQDELENLFLMTTQSNYSIKSKTHCFKRGEYGIPILVNYGEQRWHQAEELLYDLLKEHPLTKQELLRNSSVNAKAVRDPLHEMHKITAKECGILLDKLEKAGRLSYEKTSRGKGKILVHGGSLK